MSLADRWSQILSVLRADGRFRTLIAGTGVDLSSNDYLGYAAEQPRGQAAGAAPASDELPRSGTASRLLRGQHEIWERVEFALAAWHGAEACLVMNSGYVANEGLLSTIIQEGDWVASDQCNHASIIDGLRLSRAERFVYRHAELNHLEDGIRAARRGARRELFIVTESLFGMEGDVAPLAELANLAERYAAHVIVDEAHATGCFGESGAGLIDQLGLRKRVLATVHTGGKALAVNGAYICGSPALRDLVVNRCRHFMFSTALPPVVGAWWLEAIERVQPDSPRRDRLHERAKFLRSELRRRTCAARGTAYIVPVVVGDDGRCAEVAAALQATGWDIRAIRSPTVPAGTARLRISIHANHTTDELAAAAAAVAKALEGTR